MENLNLIESKLNLESRIKSSANWFYWIAGLSLINTIITFTGGSISFIFGLGITQIIDITAYYFTEEFGNIATYIAVGIDVFISCIFILIGKFAGKRKKWAFIIGIVLFALDGLIFLLWSDYLSIAFHVWAIYSIYLGIPAMKHLEEVNRQIQEQEARLHQEPEAQEYQHQELQEASIDIENTDKEE